MVSCFIQTLHSPSLFSRKDGKGVTTYANKMGHIPSLLNYVGSMEVEVESVRSFNIVNNERSGLVMKVVASAISTIIANICGERMPRS